MKLLLTVMAVLLVLLACPALADVIIQQVLYDPLGTESGGEAVELYNTGSEAVNISGWTLSTESSSKDATIPQNTLLGPGESFLIADTGWDDAKDNPEWCSASYEETLTLTNSDAGIALVDSDDDIVDAVGWGEADNIDDGLFESSPAALVEPGKSLFRVQNTNNNKEDFEEREPLFLCNDDVLVEADVGSSFSARILEDDDGREGVQIKPPRKSITIEACEACETCRGVAILKDQQVQITNGSAVLSLEGISAGNHTVIVSFEDEQVELFFEYLPLKQFSVLSRHVKVGKTPLRIVNQGNLELKLRVSASDLRLGNFTIAREFLFIDGSSLEDFVLLSIGPGEEKTFDLELKPPGRVRSGTYRTVLKLGLE